MASTLDGVLLDGRWRLVSCLGGCAFQLFDARDEKTGAKVLVKLFDTAWVASTVLEERRVGALIGHPAFVRVLDAGTDAGLSRAFAVQEQCGGHSLEDLLEQGPADLLEAVTIARELLSALEAAHAKNVILGRLSPRDIRVVHDSAGVHVRIFATFAGDAVPAAPVVDRHAPPEHLGGLRCGGTVESDLYRVGAILHEMLAGEPPFDGNDALSILSAIRDGKPAPIRSELGVPLRLQQAIWKALEKNPVNRFRNAKEFAAAIEATG